PGSRRSSSEPRPFLTKQESTNGRPEAQDLPETLSERAGQARITPYPARRKEERRFGGVETVTVPSSPSLNRETIHATGTSLGALASSPASTFNRESISAADKKNRER